MTTLTDAQVDAAHELLCGDGLLRDYPMCYRCACDLLVYREDSIRHARECSALHQLLPEVTR